MKGKNSGLYLMVAVCLVLPLAGPCLAGTTGLVMDSRGYAYTADSGTGCILCLTPDGERIVHARVDDVPTALAVDTLRTLFVGTNSGRIYAVLLDGSVSLVHTCPGRVTGLDVDRDGSLLAATMDGAVIRVPREAFVWEER